MSIQLRCTVFAIIATVVFGCLSAAAETNFRTWLENFRREAEAEGISRTVYQEAFVNISEPDTLVLERAAYQPEFTQKVWDYLDNRVNGLSISRGAKMRKVHSDTLSRIEAEYGVSASVILAIWSMESNYGLVLEKKHRLHYVPQALATLAWGDPKRGKFGRNQLIAALKILQAGDVDRAGLLGSWAGAMGHTQFIPTSYLAYGVDLDGDGRRDIWNSIPDALATAANLLARNGWRSGRTWGYEVKMPAAAGRYDGQTKTLSEWQALGFRRPGGRSFPRQDERAELKILAGDTGPGFLMVKNFFVIKKYNNSDFYALAVGLLADRLAGWDGMVQSWPKPAGSLSFDEKFELQRLLKKRGFYDGEIDGRLGKGSRQAIKDFQESSGLPADGEPTTTVLHSLRR